MFFLKSPSFYRIFLSVMIPAVSLSSNLETWYTSFSPLSSLFSSTFVSFGKDIKISFHCHSNHLGTGFPASRCCPLEYMFYTILNYLINCILLYPQNSFSWCLLFVVCLAYPEFENLCNMRPSAMWLIKVFMFFTTSQAQWFNDSALDIIPALVHLLAHTIPVSRLLSWNSLIIWSQCSYQSQLKSHGLPKASAHSNVFWAVGDIISMW